MNKHADKSPRRGRRALHPWQIPRRGWWDICRRIRREIIADNIFIVSEGVAFSALMAIFPLLAAVISVYGLVSSRAELKHHLGELDQFMHMNLSNSLAHNLHSVVSGSGFALSLGVAVSLLIALYSSIRAIMGLIRALNIIYDEDEKRGLATLIFISCALGIGALAFWLIALVAVVAAPIVMISLSHEPDVILPLIAAIRWTVITLAALISMAVLYRFGPSHTKPKWEWLSYGTIAATLFWLAGSALLSFYIANFGSFNRIYGALGAVVILQIWFFLTSFIFLLGAEINIEMQRQTHRDISA